MSWLDHFLDTKSKRRCLLFIIMLLAMTLCAFYNARMGYLLQGLTDMDQVFKLTSNSWVNSSWLGRLVLSLLETPLQLEDFIRCFLASFHPEQLWFLVLTLLFICSKRDKETTSLMKISAFIAVLLEGLMLVVCGWFIYRTYFSMTTLKAITTFQLCGTTMLIFSMLQIGLACLVGPLVCVRNVATISHIQQTKIEKEK